MLFWVTGDLFFAKAPKEGARRFTRRGAAVNLQRGNGF